MGDELAELDQKILIEKEQIRICNQLIDNYKSLILSYKNDIEREKKIIQLRRVYLFELFNKKKEIKENGR